MILLTCGVTDGYKIINNNNRNHCLTTRLEIGIATIHMDAKIQRIPNFTFNMKTTKLNGSFYDLIALVNELFNPSGLLNKLNKAWGEKHLTIIIMSCNLSIRKKGLR